MADGGKIKAYADGKFLGDMNAVLKTAATINKEVEFMLLQQMQQSDSRYLETTRYQQNEVLPFGRQRENRDQTDSEIRD